MPSSLESPSDAHDIEFLADLDLPLTDEDTSDGSLPVDRRTVVGGIFGLIGLAASGVSLQRMVGGSSGTPSSAGIRTAVESAVSDTMPSRIAADSVEAAAEAAGSAINSVGSALERAGSSPDTAAPAPPGAVPAGTDGGATAPAAAGPAPTQAPTPATEPPSGSAPTANPKPSPRSRPTADPVERPTPATPEPRRPTGPPTPDDGPAPDPSPTPEETPTPEPPPPPADIAAETAVLKLTFGPRPGQIAEVRATGSDAFIEDQLQRSGPDPEIEDEILTIEPVHMTPKELSDARIRNWWMRNYT
ncbi:MAG: hypothetical protein AAGD35_23645, partial [Actinomycetota bacterium]